MLAAELERLLEVLTDGYEMDGVAALYESEAKRCRFRPTRTAEFEDGETASSFADERPSGEDPDDRATRLKR
jgi:hypothetical protein